MPPRHKTIAPSPPPRNHRPKVKPIVASATTIALGVSGVFLAAGPAAAAPGYSEAEARYLSGTLFERSLDDIAAIAGERAVANGTTEEVVTESGDLDLSVLGDALQLQVADGVNIPLTVTDAGAVTQYAEATQSGASRAATGAVTDQGVIDLDAAPGAPEALSFDLSDLLTDELTATVADASLTAGVTTATADQTAAGTPTGDYSIAGLQANITSPVVAGISTDLVASGEALDQTVAGVLGADGSLSTDLTGVLETVGAADVTVTASTDLSAVVEETVQANSILGADGPVQVDLTTGEITVDIAALLAANGRDLNDLAPGEEIVNAELLGFVTADVDELVNGFLGEVQTAVSTALATTDLTVAGTVGDPAAPLVALNLDGTLGDIAAGTAVPVISLGDTDLDGTLLSGPISTVVATVLGLQLDTAALDADLAPLYPALSGVLSDLVSLRANLQETEDGTFTETALRLEVLNYSTDGEALAVNLAQAAVGPNAVPTVDPVDPTAPTLLGLTPIFGPETGGTEVTLTGTDLTAVDTVTFGGVAATELTVVSPTEITVLTPAGVGLVDVVVSGPNGTATLQNGFTYVPAGTGDNEPGTVVSFTPTSGPEDGGTVVTIIGTGFTGADGVNFGDSAGTDFTVVSDNEITVTTPAGTGVVPVTVIGAPNGDIEAPEAFLYVPDTSGGIPTIVAAVNPTTGPEAGGTTVNITGTGFLAVDQVLFDGNSGTELNVISDNELTVVTPAGTGQVLISLVDASPDGGTAFASVPFSYIPAVEIADPIITSITPTSGPAAGGTVVTINGENFTEGDTVSFDGVPAAGVTVVSPTVITATTPPGVGVVDVTVNRNNGQTANLPDSFTYNAVPAANGDGNGDGNTGGTDNGDLGGVIGGGNDGVAPQGGVIGGDEFANCDAAEAAGKANFASDDRNLDSDGDGFACEDNKVSADAQRDLAFTGSQGAQGAALAGVLMLLLGGVLFVIRRRFAA